MFLRPCPGELVLLFLLIVGSLLILSFRSLSVYNLPKVKLNADFSASCCTPRLSESELESAVQEEARNVGLGSLFFDFSVLVFHLLLTCWDTSPCFRPGEVLIAPAAIGGGGLDGDLRGGEALTQTWDLSWGTLLSAWFDWWFSWA